jgi:hypothetical protein
MKWFAILLTSVLLVACDYTEVEREVGYKGKARMNPWLAAERFCERYHGEVRSLVGWSPPQVDDSIWLAPAAALSNQSFVRAVDRWVEEGGHLVLLIEHANSETNDWGMLPPPLLPDPALTRFLRDSGMELRPSRERDEKAEMTEIQFNGESFAVEAKSGTRVTVHGGVPSVFASVTRGDGQLSVLTDARLFRNRWIGEKDHAALLDALVQSSAFEGNVCFLRSTGMSLWRLLGTHLWPVLIALGVWIALWLWKNFCRFGPIDAAAGESTLRGYDHHLEALGNFQWRMDRGATLLAPLRARIVERGHQLAAASGRKDDDLFQFLADRAGLPRERVFRALAESRVPDSAILTRTTADLQRLLQLLH